MTETLLYVFGSRERHSKPTKEMYTCMRPIPKEDTLWSRHSVVKTLCGQDTD